MQNVIIGSRGVPFLAASGARQLLKRLGVLVLASALLTGCAVTEPDRHRVLGTIIGFDRSDPQITLTVDGATVTATVITYGNGCYTVADTEVEVDGMEATITPYDNDPGCSQRDLKLLEHVVRVDFPEPGTVVIRVRGLDQTSLSAADLRPDTVTVVRSVALQGRL